MDDEQKRLFLLFAIDEFTEGTNRFPLGYLQSKGDEETQALRLSQLLALFDGVIAVMTPHGPIIRDPSSPSSTPEGTIFIYRANERAYAELVVTHRAILPTLVVNDERFKVAQHAFPQIYWNCSFSVVEGQRTQMVEQKPYPMWERSDPKVELISCLRKMRVGLHQLQLRAAARPPAQDEPR